MVDVVDAVLEAEAGDDAAGRAVVDAGVDAEAGDDAAGTVRVDVLVNTIVNSEAEAKGEPANDAEGDGAGLPELTYSHQCTVTQEHRNHNKLLRGHHSKLKHD